MRDRYGDIDEFDLDEWDAMDLIVCTAPEEWEFGGEDADEQPQQPQR